MLVGTMALWVARPRHRSQLPVTYEAMRVNLNTADIDTLVLLPVIGPNLAERIINYRTLHGPFGSVEQLQAVHGIGQSTIKGLALFVQPFGSAKFSTTKDAFSNGSVDESTD